MGSMGVYLVCDDERQLGLATTSSGAGFMGPRKTPLSPKSTDSVLMESPASLWLCAYCRDECATICIWIHLMNVMFDPG